jgi:hypothetical protein
MENKGTNAARAGTVNALTWNVMAAFSYRGMIQAKRKRLSTNSGVHADIVESAATSQYANHRPEAMHPDVRWVFHRMRGTRPYEGWFDTLSSLGDKSALDVGNM